MAAYGTLPLEAPSRRPSRLLGFAAAAMAASATVLLATSMYKVRLIPYATLSAPPSPAPLVDVLT